MREKIDPWRNLPMTYIGMTVQMVNRLVKSGSTKYTSNAMFMASTVLRNPTMVENTMVVAKVTTRTVAR